MMNILRRFKNRISLEKGFSIAEMLIAVLILLMVSSVVAAGVPVAAQAYVKITDAADAESLLSTTMTMLRSELSTADSATVLCGSTDGCFVQYRNLDSGSLYTITAPVSDGIPQQITVNNGSVTTNFVAAQDAMGSMYTSFTGAEYSNGVITIKGLAVYKNEKAITDPQDFSIRVINY